MAVGQQVDRSGAWWTGDAFHSECAGREVFEHLTGRWVPLILCALQPGPLRFFELRQLIDGISEKMLSAKLRTLVRDGLLTRTVRPTSPPQVTYQLTEMGHVLSRPFAQLIGSIATYTTEVVAAQERYDAGLRDPAT
jgi:DNA-binding HxlR family transcriptional regulator